MWVLHAKALSTKDTFYLSVSRYEISGKDLGWVWLRPEMGKCGSLKGEREVIAGQKSGDGRMLRYHCSTPRPPISQTNHSFSIGLPALPPHCTQSSLKPGQSCVQLTVPKAKDWHQVSPQQPLVGHTWGAGELSASNNE